MFFPFSLCVKQPFGDLPFEAIFFVCELSLPNPILLWNFMEKGRIVILAHPMYLGFILELLAFYCAFIFVGTLIADV